MKISNQVYDILKWIAQYVLPAIGTLYFALANIWGFPYGEQVVGTITAIDAFLGVILGISTSSYERDGTLQIDTSRDSLDKWNFKLDTPVSEVLNRKTVSFKVDTKSKF